MWIVRDVLSQFVWSLASWRQFSWISETCRRVSLLLCGSTLSFCLAFSLVFRSVNIDCGKSGKIFSNGYIQIFYSRFSWVVDPWSIIAYGGIFAIVASCSLLRRVGVLALSYYRLQNCRKLCNVNDLTSCGCVIFVSENDIVATIPIYYLFREEALLIGCREIEYVWRRWGLLQTRIFSPTLSCLEWFKCLLWKIVATCVVSITAINLFSRLCGSFFDLAGLW